MEDIDQFVEITADVVSAYVSNNKMSPEDVSGLISSVYSAFKRLEGSQADQALTSATPAVDILQSVTDTHLVCLEDGMKFRSLKRHLKAHHGLSPEQYREKWGLDKDYPMVAPSYSIKRSQLARQSGLGRKPKS